MRFLEDRKSRAPVINVTSLIDVVFLLVIFLLITAKFDQEGGIPVDLPKGKLEQAPAAQDSFTVTIVHDGTLFVDKKKILLGELAGEIKALREKMPDPIMCIKTDSEAESQYLVNVMEVARLCGQKFYVKTKK